MVNSSWTQKHVSGPLHPDSDEQREQDICQIQERLAYPPFGRWGVVRVRIVYPSCDTREMALLPLGGRARAVPSITQLRQEICALHALLEGHPQYAAEGIQVVLIGGCRIVAGEARIEDLRNLAADLGVKSRVQRPASSPSHTACHTPQARTSSSPSKAKSPMRSPILPSSAFLFSLPYTKLTGLEGYHVKTPADFAAVIHAALTLSPEEDVAIRARARTWAVQRFSEAEFEAAWEASGRVGFLARKH
ncbi:hypothetical protein C8R46DRAFT_1034614 [Mycena filopes]|nr:hypothetical protein C8R46DRAFT_1034614 [Mycena filopes]